MSKKLNLPFALGIFLIGLFSAPSSSKAVTYYWDTTAGAANGTGGAGTFTTAGLTWSTDPLGSATLVANAGTTNDIANFQGTAGTVTWNNNITQNAFNVSINNYTFTTASATGRTLTGTALTLGNNVNLNLSSFSAGQLRFASNVISGGTGSSITLSGGASGKRAVTLDSGANVASTAPIIFTTTATLPAGDYIALGNSTGTGTVNSTVTGNLGATDMTFFSTGTGLLLNGAVSGSSGVSIGGNGLTHSGRIELNASNSYAGKTTLNGGTVYVSNNFAFSTNSIVVASNSTIRGIGVLTNNQIANAVEFGTSGANLTIGGYDNSNSISFNGLISGSGSVSAAAKTGSTSYSAYLMNTNNTFNGGVFSSNGYTMFVANLGNKADTKSAIGTGAISLGNATTSGSLRWLGTGGNEISDKDFTILGTNAILANGATNATLTLNGAINSTVGGDKRITFAGYSSNTLTINGLINEYAGSTNSVVIGASSSGTVVLANTNNSFSGAITITNGTSGQSTYLSTANIGNANANSTLGRNGTINIGSSSSGALTGLKYTGTGETSDKVINLAGTSGGAILDQSGTGNLKFTSALTGTGVGAKTITLQGSSAGTGEFSGEISDIGGNQIGVTKSGTGTWKLSASNSYSGNTIINSAGLLEVGSANALSTKSSLLGASSSASTGTLDLKAGGNYFMNSFGTATTGGFNMNFTNSSGAAATLRFTNADNYITIASNNSGGRSLQNQSSNLDIRFDGNIEIGSTTNADVTFGGAGNFFVNGAVKNSTNGVRGLQKTGSGNMTLAGTGNNYNGSTLVDSGTLSLLGTLTGSTNLTVSTTNTISSASTTRTATATLNVASGASLLNNSTTTVYSGGNLIANGAAGAVVLENNGLLGGSGTVGAVTLKSGSILNPGNSPGLLTAASSSWAAGATYNWEINQAGNGTAGVNWDVFSVVGALDLSALSSTAQMNLVLNSLPSMDDFSATTPYSWVFAQAGSFVGTDLVDGADVTSLFNIDSAAFNGGVGPANGFKVQVGTANGLQTLNLMAIPEPSTGSLMMFGLSGLVLTRLLRRKVS